VNALRRVVISAALFQAASSAAFGQMPFVTDDAGVTPKGGTHIECFDEYDWLQSGRFPHLRQNTVNGRLNTAFGHGLELDLAAGQHIQMRVGVLEHSQESGFALGADGPCVERRVRLPDQLEEVAESLRQVQVVVEASR